MMRGIRFFPNVRFVSVLAIALGLLIITVPNILEYVIAFVLIFSGLAGLFAGSRRTVYRF